MLPRCLWVRLVVWHSLGPITALAAVVPVSCSLVCAHLLIRSADHPPLTYATGLPVVPLLVQISIRRVTKGVEEREVPWNDWSVSLCFCSWTLSLDPPVESARSSYSSPVIDSLWVPLSLFSLSVLLLINRRDEQPSRGRQMEMKTSYLDSHVQIRNQSRNKDLQRLRSSSSSPLQV